MDELFIKYAALAWCPSHVLNSRHHYLEKDSIKGRSASTGAHCKRTLENYTRYFLRESFIKRIGIEEVRMQPSSKHSFTEVI